MSTVLQADSYHGATSDIPIYNNIVLLIIIYQDITVILSQSGLCAGLTCGRACSVLPCSDTDEEKGGVELLDKSHDKKQSGGYNIGLLELFYFCLIFKK